MPSKVDEGALDGAVPPDELVKALARRKTRSVSADYAGDLVLGADTIVFIDGQILGKPLDREDARAMLRRISGRTHQVYTGIALYEPLGRTVLDDFDVTSVTMAAMDEEQIERYVATGES